MVGGVEFRKACSEGNLKVVNQLCNEQVLNSRGETSQNTALHFAAQNNHRDVVIFLCAKSADLNAVNAKGNTPLLQALIAGHAEIAMLLLDLKCSALISNAEKFNALQVARKNSKFNQQPTLFNRIKERICEEAVTKSAELGEVTFDQNDNIVFKNDRIPQLETALEALNLNSNQDMPPATVVSTSAAQPNKATAFHYHDNSNARKQVFEYLTHLDKNCAKNPKNLRLNDKLRIVRGTLCFPPGKELLFKEKKIVKIITIDEVHKEKPDPTVQAEEATIKRAHVVIKYSDKTIDIYQAGSVLEADLRKSSVSSAQHLVKHRQAETPLFLLGMIVDHEFILKDFRKIEDWKSFPITSYYDAVVAKDYMAQYQTLAGNFVQFLKDNRIQQPLSLYSFGCGAGFELHVSQVRATQAGFKVVQTVGFDINPQNFVKTRSEFANITLLQGDFNDIGTCLMKAPLAKGTFKLAFLNGVIADQVVSGTYQALSVIQQMRPFDRIAIAGITSILTNRRWLKSAGFDVDMNFRYMDISADNAPPNTVAANKVINLNWMSPATRQAYLSKRSIKRSSEHKLDCLDLSMSANPLQDLRLFKAKDFADLKLIDISWSYFKPNEISQFFAYLFNDICPTGNIKIIISTHEPFYADLEAMATQHPRLALFKRLDVANKNELPEFSPVEAKKWGVYEKFICERLGKPKLGI